MRAPGDACAAVAAFCFAAFARTSSSVVPVRKLLQVRRGCTSLAIRNRKASAVAFSAVAFASCSCAVRRSVLGQLRLLKRFHLVRRPSPAARRPCGLPFGVEGTFARVAELRLIGHRRRRPMRSVLLGLRSCCWFAVGAAGVAGVAAGMPARRAGPGFRWRLPSTSIAELHPPASRGQGSLSAVSTAPLAASARLWRRRPTCRRSERAG